MSKERWKIIAGFPKYKVSSLGRVRGPGCRHQGQRILKTFPNGNSYPTVRLVNNGYMINRRVHRLVLEAFKGPCPKGMEADHINFDRSDSSLSNLRWLTREENMKRRRRIGRLPNHLKQDKGE